MKKKILGLIITFVLGLFFCFNVVKADDYQDLASQALYVFESYVYNLYNFGEFEKPDEIDKDEFLMYVMTTSDFSDYIIDAEDYMYGVPMYFYYKIPEAKFFEQAKKVADVSDEYLGALKECKVLNEGIKDLTNLTDDNYMYKYENGYFHFEIRYFNAGGAGLASEIVGFKRVENGYAIYYQMVDEVEGVVGKYVGIINPYSFGDVKFISNESISSVPSGIVTFDSEFVDISSKILDGEDFYSIGVDEGYKMKLNIDLGNFAVAFVDDEMLFDDYTLDKENSVLTFSSEFLDELNDGNHTIVVLLNNGEALIKEVEFIDIMNLSGNNKKAVDPFLDAEEEEEVENPATGTITVFGIIFVLGLLLYVVGNIACRKKSVFKI